MNVTATTLPRRSRSESRALFCVVNVNSGAGPIFDSCASAFASCPVAALAQPAAASAATIATHHARRQPMLALQLLLELVDEAPIGVLGEELLRAALKEPAFVETERVETQGIRRAVLAPLAVGGDLLEILHRPVVTFRKPSVHERPGDALGL